MATKRQHFVPQIYMKAWECTVESQSEPNKKFQGVYEFEQDCNIGNWKNRDSILWQPHLYTIGFDYLFFIAKSCPLVYSFFVDQIFKLMRNNTPIPIYGEFGHSIIKTKDSVRKHLYNINDWDFYYDDGNLARKKSILNRIHDLNCYILESAFDDSYEKRWEIIYKHFINEVQHSIPIALDRSERKIDKNAAVAMIEFFFMMLCRSPQFNAMGIYTVIKERLLYPLFKENEVSDKLMTGIWYSELYRMFFKKSGGFYHSVIEKTMDYCQMILFEAYDNAGTFITSDNPSFQHRSLIERTNSSGFIFPLTPKHLLFIGKGEPNSINVVDYRFADKNAVQHFNRIIKSHKSNILISIQPTLDNLI